MSDPTTLVVPTRQTKSSADETVVVTQDSSVSHADDALPMPSKTDTMNKVATAEHGGVEKAGPLKESIGATETPRNQPTASFEEFTTDTTNSRVPVSKPTSSRQTATGAGSNRAASSKSELGTDVHLLQRLAGPSVGKAGLARDQTEITRLIARASEGSKYYEVSYHKGISYLKFLTRL